jgi:hypothetical protein
VKFFVYSDAFGHIKIADMPLCQMLVGRGNSIPVTSSKFRSHLHYKQDLISLGLLEVCRDISIVKYEPIVAELKCSELGNDTNPPFVSINGTDVSIFFEDNWGSTEYEAVLSLYGDLDMEQIINV